MSLNTETHNVFAENVEVIKQISSFVWIVSVPFACWLCYFIVEKIVGMPFFELLIRRQNRNSNKIRILSDLSGNKPAFGLLSPLHRRGYPTRRSSMAEK